MAIHPLATEGFGRAATIAAYERGRTAAAPEAVDHLVEALALGADSVVADVGAGTGKLSRLLAPSGAAVIGVEPVAAMREGFRHACELPLVGAAAEGLPFPPGSLDALTAAQAFHWFDGPRALAEFARVLRPGGGLALVWSGREAHEGWTARINEIIEAHRGPEPSAWSGKWLDAFRAEPAGAFTSLEYAGFDYPFETTAEGVVDRFASVSFIAVLSDPERTAVLDAIRTVLRDDLGAEGDDPVVYPYTTHLFWCRRR